LLKLLKLRLDAATQMFVVGASSIEIAARSTEDEILSARTQICVSFTLLSSLA